MDKNYIYNPYNQFDEALVSLNGIPLATSGVAGKVQMATGANTSVTYDATQVDALISTATHGGITAIVKSADSSDALLINKVTSTVTVTLKDASTTQKGLVQLDSATNSTSASTAATSLAVKNTFDLANSKLGAFTIATSSGNVTVDSGNASFNIVGDNVIKTSYVAGSKNLTVAFDANAAKGALGLGSAAYVNTGNANGNVPLIAGSYLAQSIIPGIKVIDQVDKTEFNLIGGANTGLSFQATAGSGRSANVTLNVNAGTFKSYLSLGSAANANTGTGSGNVPVLDGSGKLPESTIPSIALVDIIEVATANNMADVLAVINGKTAEPLPKQGDMVIVLAGAFQGNLYIIKTTKVLPGTPYVAADLIPIKVPTSTVNTISQNGVSYTPTNGLVTLGNVISNVTGAGNGISVNVANNTANVSLALGTTSTPGALKLNDSQTSTSVTEAATPNAVNAIGNIARAAAPQATTFTKTECDNKFATNTALGTTNGNVSALDARVVNNTNNITSLTNNKVNDVITAAPDWNVALTRTEANKVITLSIPSNTLLAYGPIIADNDRNIPTNATVSQFAQGRLYNKEIDVLSSVVNSGASGPIGTYEYVWTAPSGVTRVSPPKVVSITLSSGDQVMVPITYDANAKKITIKFYNPADPVATVYGGVFNTPGNRHTIVLSQGTVQ